MAESNSYIEVLIFVFQKLALHLWILMETPSQSQDFLLNFSALM